MNVPEVLTSKRFIVFVIAAVIDLAIMFINNPTLEANRLPLIESITLIALTLIVGYTGQDVAAAWKGNATKYHEVKA